MKRLVWTILLAAAVTAIVFLRPGDNPAPWHGTDLSGVMPPLKFTLTRVSDGKQVTAADYRGRVVMLYFGYTSCPDLCPASLMNATAALKKLGAQAQRVRVLFVTVDPNRDTPAVLEGFVKNFPQVDGLRGTPDQLAALARRYRVAYSVTLPKNGRPYIVTHSSSFYVFDAAGAARLLVPSLSTDTPDIDGAAADLKRLLAENPD